MAWPCTFSSYTSRGPGGVSPWYRRGRSHLDSMHLATCFKTYPKATFMTTQLRSSVWKPQSMTYTIWDSTSILGQRTLVCVSFARLTDSTYSWSHSGSIQHCVLNTYLYCWCNIQYRYDPWNVIIHPTHVPTYLYVTACNTHVFASC